MSFFIFQSVQIPVKMYVKSLYTISAESHFIPFNKSSSFWRVQEVEPQIQNNMKHTTIMKY